MQMKIQFKIKTNKLNFIIFTTLIQYYSSFKIWLNFL